MSSIYVKLTIYVSISVSIQLGRCIYNKGSRLRLIDTKIIAKLISENRII